MVRKKPLDPYELDATVRTLAASNPELVSWKGSPLDAAKWMAGIQPQGQRRAMTLDEYRQKRAAAVAKLGRRASLRTIGLELHLSEGSIRNYDARLLGRAPFGNAPDGRDGT
jgi:hypothetical protein